jgi:hypothetical protein
VTVVVEVTGGGSPPEGRGVVLAMSQATSSRALAKSSVWPGRVRSNAVKIVLDRNE